MSKQQQQKEEDTNKQRDIIALDRQGTQQQRPESPTVTPPGVREMQGTETPPKVHPQKRMPPVAYIPSISNTLGDTGVYRHTTEPVFIQDRT